MLIRLFLGLVVAGAVSAGVAYWDYDRFLSEPVSVDDGNKLFVVERGWSARRVSRELAEQNVITKTWWFDVLARVSGKASKIKSGEYVLSDDLNPNTLLDLLLTGKTTQHSFAIIEGSQFRELKARLPGATNLKNTIDSLTDAEIMAKLGKPDVHPEGQFFSDTYQYNKNSTDLEYLQRATNALDKILEEEWQARAPDLPLATAYEALILASIVEKETAVAAERPLIAGVFLSRLKIKMRLQTDPTVIYGMGENFDGNIRRKDLRTDTPYNTYTRGGLPPTPIAMVGREAIHAVLHPDETTALFFVAKGDGTHYFSETVEEHNKAVRKYQLKR